MKILAGIMVLAAIHLAAQTKPLAKRYTLSGTIVDGISRRPLPGVDLSLQTEKWGVAGEATISDATGHFAFGGLAAGQYILSATGRSFGTVRYGEAPDPGWVSTVQVGIKGDDKNVLFPVMPRAAIEGVVRDGFNDPMARANVTVLRPVWREGRTILTSVAQKMTDDRGRYRIANLAPGDYIVCTTGNSNSSMPVPLQGPVDFAVRPENRFYVRTCYPAANRASTRTLQLAPGQDAQVDLIPLVAPAVTVRGHVRNAPNKTGFGVQLRSEDAFEGAPQTFGTYQFDAVQGTFAIRGVPPGRYRLSANVYVRDQDGSGKQLSAELPVDVGSADVDGLDLMLDTGGTVDVVFRGLAENHTDSSTVNADLRRADSSRSSFGAPSDKDGTVHFQAIPPGRYWLTTRTAGDVCAESVKVGDREVRDTPVQVAAGSMLRVNVTMSRNCGAIQMRAVRDGEAVPGAKMVLMLSGTAKDPGDLIEDYADDEGELSVSGLRPGRYLLWAWAVAGKDAVAGPTSLSAAEQQAVSVQVTAGEPAKIDVPLLKDVGQAK